MALFGDSISERELRRAIEAMSQNNNREMAEMEARRLRDQMMYGGMPSFRDDSDRKRLKLSMDGYEVFIQTMVPRGLPVSEVANQFARHTHDLLRRFPQGWSRTGEGGSDNRVVENDDSEDESSMPDGDRFGAAFE